MMNLDVVEQSIKIVNI